MKIFGLIFFIFLGSIVGAYFGLLMAKIERMERNIFGIKVVLVAWYKNINLVEKDKTNETIYK